MIQYITSMWRRFFPSQPQPQTEKGIEVELWSPPKTYLVELDGIKNYVVKISEGGLRAVLSGFTAHHWHWRERDYLVLRVGGRYHTRYKITKIMHKKPHEIFFVECTFSPRGGLYNDFTFKVPH